MFWVTLGVVSYLTKRQLGAEIISIDQAQEPLTFADLEGNLSQQPASEDARTYYTEAFRNIRQEDLEKLPDALAQVNTVYRTQMTDSPLGKFPAQLQRAVMQNLGAMRPVLERLHQGALVPLSRFDLGIQQGKRVYHTRLLRVRSGVYLLSLQTLDLIERDRGDAAASSAIALLKLMRVFDTHPILIAHTTKAGYLKLACQDVELLLERCRLTEEALKKLQATLEGALTAYSLEKVFLSERIYQIELIRNLLPADITSRWLDSEVSDLPERLAVPATFWGRLRLRQKATQYLRDLDLLVAVARRGWPEPLDISGRGISQMAEEPGNLLSAGDAAIRLTAETHAIVRATLVAVAVKRYRERYGELPSGLHELTPEYFSSLPLDPFSGKPLLFHGNTDMFTVYSVGANRENDNGSIGYESPGSNPLDLGISIRLANSA